MPNIRKSFSFRDGVQVDDDDFIVRGNLVGIGTTIPSERLDVKGNVAVAGLVTTTELHVTGVSTFAEVKLGTGINMNSSGVITATSFKGDGSTLSNLPTSQWTDVNIGAGVTSIYNTGSVGVGTTDPIYQLQIGQSPDTSTGVGIDSTGNIKATGVVTATTFTGNLTGNVTGDTTGNVTASTLNATGVSTLGVSTFTGAVSFGSSALFGDNDRITFGDVPKLHLYYDGTSASIIKSSGQMNVAIASGELIIGNTAGAAGVVYKKDDFVEIRDNNTKRFRTNGIGVTVYNQLDTTNLSISGVSTFTGVVNANGEVKVGTGGTAFTTLATGQAGVGTASPTTDFQVRKSNGSKIEVVADSGVAQVSIGQTVGAGSSVGYIRYGSVNKGLEFINNDTGNVNMVLHNGPAGVSTGRFDWKYGQTNNELMSLTYDGKLGINQTVPINTLHVVGTSTVTSHAYVGGNLSVGGNITGTFNWPSLLTGTNLNNTSGISTFNNVNVTSKVGISSALPAVDLDAKGKTALFGGIGINTTQNNLYGNELLVQGNATFASTVGFGTTAPKTDLVGSTGLIQVHDNDIVILNGGVSIDAASESYIGIGTTAARATVDFSMVGGMSTTGYMLPPVITTAAQVGLSTIIGGVVYNSTTNKLQCYTPTGWQDLF